MAVSLGVLTMSWILFLKLEIMYSVTYSIVNFTSTQWYDLIVKNTFSKVIFKKHLKHQMFCIPSSKWQFKLIQVFRYSFTALIWKSNHKTIFYYSVRASPLFWNWNHFNPWASFSLQWNLLWNQLVQTKRVRIELC